MILHRESSSAQPVIVWDVQVRVFHWLLAALLITLVVTAKLGGNAMVWHERCGYAILTLLVFRIIWGFIGSTHSRFIDFIHSPRAVWGYAQSLLRGDAPRFAGHNPVGGLSVVAMLGAVLVQAVTGLFANDDIMLEGPLAPLISKATSDTFTRIHDSNQYVLYGLIGLHIAAITAFYFGKKENLVAPMITGRKNFEPGRAMRPGSPRRALVPLAVASDVV